MNAYGGVTLHSFFQLSFGPFVPGSDAYAARHRMRREKKQIIQSLDLLIIQRKPLRELKAALGEDCSYGDIKRVLAHLEHIQKH